SYPLTMETRVTELAHKAFGTLNSNWAASEAIWKTMRDLLTNLGGFVIYLVMLSHLEPMLLAVTLVTCTLSYLITRRTGSWSYRHKEEQEELWNRTYYIKNTAENIKTAKDVKIFGLTDWLTDIYDSAEKLMENFLNKGSRIQMAGSAAGVLFTVARNGVAYFYLITMALDRGMVASEFLLYFSAVSGFAGWISGIFKEMSTLRQHSLELCTLREYLELPEPFRFEGGVPIPAAQTYELKLEKVSYRYPEAESDTIHDLTLTIRPGEKVAIVGLNGAGKTTLVKLLSGLLDPTEGRVLLNGQDVREFNRREYYGLFSAVFQEFSVMDVTVAENVAQDYQNIDLDRVKDCIEKAGLTEKVESLPKGLDTHVGREVYEDGVLFSGGETQRLMLARALYKNGPVLLLDEPTAALDPIAENDIYMKYSDMTRGRTSLFISHRLASTRFCDRILFLGNGTVLEEGTHDQLLARGGEYAKLFEVQSRYYREGRDF
ncbi:MAG: ABC transporter ATP-binding protein/permease, partial [Oscillospiraceae bacterium]|nr:ABC transporter ATP-binding protein/permease [Oscillospiraceae bacterium]